MDKLFEMPRRLLKLIRIKKRFSSDINRVFLEFVENTEKNYHGLKEICDFDGFQMKAKKKSKRIFGKGRKKKGQRKNFNTTLKKELKFMLFFMHIFVLSTEHRNDDKNKNNRNKKQ